MLYGSVVGTVTDQSDAVVPNATVTLTSKETGQSPMHATSDDGGRYSFVNVLPGRYDVKVVGQGIPHVDAAGSRCQPEHGGARRSQDWKSAS